MTRARALALAWLAVVALAAWSLHLTARGGGGLFTSDLLALLPETARSPAAAAANARMARAGERRIVVLLGGASTERLAAAAAALERALPGDLFETAVAGDQAGVPAWLSGAFSRRGELLAQDDRALLAAEPFRPSLWRNRALQRLYAPVAADGVAWKDDPFGWFSAWAGALLADLPAFTREDGRTWISAGDEVWAVVERHMRASPFAREYQERAAAAVTRGIEAARRLAPGMDVLRAGVLFHADASATRAEREITIIGGLSFAFAVLLLLLMFESWWPVVWCLAPLLAALVFATAVGVALFGQVHLLTLVFGATLIGVTIDYAIHVSSRAWTPPGAAAHAPLAALLLAGGSTTLAYLAIAVTPLPGLRQIGVFCATGVVGAWLSTVLWLPQLPRAPAKFGALARYVGAGLGRWPRLDRAATRWCLVMATLVALGGLAHLRTGDDVRRMLAPQPDLVREQQRVETLLHLPSPGQYFLVRGASPEAVLQREEAMHPALAQLRDTGAIEGWAAVSALVPSRARGRATAALQARALDHPALLASLNAAAIGDPRWPQRLREALGPAAPDPAARIERLGDNPFGELWLGGHGDGFASIVAVRGVRDPDRLRRAAQGAGEGVTWVDRAARASHLLGIYRHYLTGGLIAAYLLVGGALWWRFGGSCWRILAAPALASVFALALNSLLGLEFNLFLVAALFLVLGVGLDFSIFLTLERRYPAQRWAAVSAAAMTTLVSIGLLAFSTTPVVRTFGVTALAGVALAWLLAPLFTVPGSERCAT